MDRRGSILAWTPAWIQSWPWRCGCPWRRSERARRLPSLLPEAPRPTLRSQQEKVPFGFPPPHTVHIVTAVLQAVCTNAVP